jgi:hypothetical protein
VFQSPHGGKLFSVATVSGIWPLQLLKIPPQCKPIDNPPLPYKVRAKDYYTILPMQLGKHGWEISGPNTTQTHLKYF